MDRAGGPVAVAIREAHSQLEALAGLGLPHLPRRIGELAAGMLYSIVCDQQALRLPLAAAALHASLAAGRRCVLVTPTDPAMFLRKARLAGFDLAAYTCGGELVVFQLAADAGKQLFRAGPAAFLKAFEQDVDERQAFVVLDHADPVFMLADPGACAEAARAYLEWLAARRHTALALFAPGAQGAREYLNLKLVAENFAGFAVTRASEGGGSLEIRHWFTAHGASPRETFALHVHARGALRVAQGAEDELPPGDAVVYLRAALPAETPGCDAWQPVDSLAEALLAARGSDWATVLLPFSRPADFAPLCRAVAGLRSSGRGAVRVLVRERGPRLRALQALALLRLGVSCIVPADVSDIGAKRMVELAARTRFAPACEVELETLEQELAALAAPTTEARAFCDAVEALLAAADGFDFPCALLRIAADGVDTAKLVWLARRAGRDLVALAQRDRAWLFVFGCPPAQLAALTARLFADARPQGALTWSAEPAVGAIVAELEALRRG